MTKYLQLRKKVPSLESFAFRQYVTKHNCFEGDTVVVVVWFLTEG